MEIVTVYCFNLVIPFLTLHRNVAWHLAETVSITHKHTICLLGWYMVQLGWVRGSGGSPCKILHLYWTFYTTPKLCKNTLATGWDNCLIRGAHFTHSHWNFSGSPSHLTLGGNGEEWQPLKIVYNRKSLAPRGSKSPKRIHLLLPTDVH